MNPELFVPAGLPVPVREDAPKVAEDAEDPKGWRIVRTEEAVFAAQPRATHFRYPYVYGPYQLVPREWCIVRRVLDGRRVIVLPEDGLTLHHFGYAENLAHPVLLGLDHPEAAAGQIYHCADEEVLTLRQVVEIVAGALGHRFEIVSMPCGSRCPRAPCSRSRCRRTACSTSRRSGASWAPVLLTIDRDGTRLSASFKPVRQELGLTTVAADTVALLASRLVQLAALVLALVIALKRPADGSAPLTAGLLASVGVFTVLLPYGFAHFWRLVPLLLQPLLWVPYLSSFVAPAIFIAFATEFPRPLFRDRRQLIWWCAPALLVAAWHARVAYVTVYKEARITIGPDWSQVAGLLSIGYLLAGLVVLIVQYRRLDQVSDRRRLIAPGEQCLAGRRADGGGVETIVLQAARRQLVQSRCLAGPARRWTSRSRHRQ